MKHKHLQLQEGMWPEQKGNVISVEVQKCLYRKYCLVDKYIAEKRWSSVLFKYVCSITSVHRLFLYLNIIGLLRMLYFIFREF